VVVTGLTRNQVTAILRYVGSNPTLSASSRNRDRDRNRDLVRSS
jgi:hypothetical protein